MTKPLHLTKAMQRQVDAVAAVFAPWGLAWTVEAGGKHAKMKVVGPKGGVWSVTIACTPRNEDHAVNTARQLAQRTLRAINKSLGL